jgi:ferredoxin
MIFSGTPNAFDNIPTIRSLTRKQALATLRRAAEAGLVHSVSNSQHGHWYLCNCCTCSCGILRGLAEMGVSNVVARSSFVNHVEEEGCVGCELCVEFCPFEALTCDGLAQVDEARCVGCGVCAVHCPEGALWLIPRPESEVLPPPENIMAWRRDRARVRGLRLEDVL